MSKSAEHEPTEALDRLFPRRPPMQGCLGEIMDATSSRSFNLYFRALSLDILAALQAHLVPLAFSRDDDCIWLTLE